MGDCGLGRLRGRKMIPLQWVVLVWVPLAVSQPAPPNCCATKTVGGVSYTFVREDSAAISYSCLSPCVYERDDQPGTAFCFAQGDQQGVCGDSTGGATSAPRVVTWSFGMSEAVECVKPGTSVIFEWSGSSHNVDKVGSAEDYASCSGITDTTGVSGPYTWQAPTSEGNHYFVCGVSVHCSVGNMKAAVEVSNNC